MAEKVLHRQQCAAITNGCTSALIWESRTAEAEPLRTQFLTQHGWRLDHGRWICDQHEVRAPKEGE